MSGKIRKGKLEFRDKRKKVRATVDACGNWHCTDDSWLEWLERNVPADLYSGPADGFPVLFYAHKAASFLRNQGVEVTKLETPDIKSDPNVVY